LENFISKSIPTADKPYFQPTGKGDLCIRILNGKTTTTILLTNVIFFPDMIVSISKLYTAGLPLAFWIVLQNISFQE
jgi:hypothetical protein